MTFVGNSGPGPWDQRASARHFICAMSSSTDMDKAVVGFASHMVALRHFGVHTKLIIPACNGHGNADDRQSLSFLRSLLTVMCPTSLYRVLLLPLPSRLFICAKLYVPFPRLQPLDHSLDHSNDMRHTTSIWVQDQWKHYYVFFSNTIAHLAPNPIEFILPHILHHTHVNIAVRVGYIREVLKGRHVFGVPVCWNFNQCLGRRGTRSGERLHPVLCGSLLGILWRLYRW